MRTISFVLAILVCIPIASSLDLSTYERELWQDRLNPSKFEEIFSQNKTDEFINGLRTVGEKTKQTLKKAAVFGKQLSSESKPNFNNFFGYIIKFNKEYNDELKERFEKFSNSLKKIEADQKDNPEAEFGPTQFSDLSPEEFIKVYTGVQGEDHVKQLHGVEEGSDGEELIFRSKRSIPANFSWVAKNKVTGIRDQGRCGCCYAFAAVGAVESQYAIKTGKLVDLSEQQVISCTYGNTTLHGSGGGGCSAGSAPSILQYIEDNGVCAEADFKYVSGTDLSIPACVSEPAVTKITKFKRIPENSEIALEIYLHFVGPVVTYVDATPLQHYKSGILNAKEPSGGWTINHAIVTVGWGTSNNVSYWLIKNQWGSSWGEQGYFRVKKGVNQLNLAQYNWVPYK
ncbi:unnamed protein product [Bursaphelenchus xylophilus]|uniref:(pine wood nematode) hypothetical protein n=1 Tax=Bursaphelenchus xylophilus TaxID=6326 RepID=A0A1I7RMP6_BURXY|nr:unnamed protein product [Bursaphelenchus xylophilus]CAG9125608.1 unnamed protein product [Bursaphelenchus xylophilus]